MWLPPPPTPFNTPAGGQDPLVGWAPSLPFCPPVPCSPACDSKGTCPCVLPGPSSFPPSPQGALAIAVELRSAGLARDVAAWCLAPAPELAVIAMHHSRGLAFGAGAPSGGPRSPTTVSTSVEHTPRPAPFALTKAAFAAWDAGGGGDGGGGGGAAAVAGSPTGHVGADSPAALAGEVVGVWGGGWDGEEKSLLSGLYARSCVRVCVPFMCVCMLLLLLFGKRGHDRAAVVVVTLRSYAPTDPLDCVLVALRVQGLSLRWSGRA